MTLKQYKEGSRVQQCWLAYQQGGVDAFITKAKKLELKDGTIKEWTRMFARNMSGEDTTKKRVKAVPLAKPANAPAAVSGAPYGRAVPAPAGKDGRVFYCGNPRLAGTVLVAGATTSKVKWDNGNVNDNVPNNDLHKLSDLNERINATGRYQNADQAYRGAGDEGGEGDQGAAAGQQSNDGQRGNQAEQRPDIRGSKRRKALGKSVRARKRR